MLRIILEEVIGQIISGEVSKLFKESLEQVPVEMSTISSLFSAIPTTGSSPFSCSMFSSCFLVSISSVVISSPFLPFSSPSFSIISSSLSFYFSCSSFAFTEVEFLFRE